MNERGYLNIISGPSGAGKSTLIKRFLEENINFTFPTSMTTRKPRPGEINGDHYFFIDKKEFEVRKEKGEFLEWANVYGMYYGTLKSTILNGLNEGKCFIKDIDVQGAKSLMNLLDKKSYQSIFIAPPSIDELKQRLIDRGSEDQKYLNDRISSAQKELDQTNLFDHVIKNDKLEETYQKFELALLKK